MPKRKRFGEKGPKNHFRMYIMQAFHRDLVETENMWHELIIKDIGDTYWLPHRLESPTDMTRWSVTWRRSLRFKEGGITLELGHFRDGFHIVLRHPTTSRLPDKDLFDLQEKLFGDANISQGWTPTIEKVAPMADAIVKEIKDYFESLE